MKEYLTRVDLHQNDIYSTFLTGEDNIDFHSHKNHQLTYLIGGTTYLLTHQKSYLIPAYHFVWIPANFNHKFVHRKSKALLVHNLYIPHDKVMDGEFYKNIGIYPAPNILIDIIKYTDNNTFKNGTKEFVFVQSFLNILPQFCNDQFNFVLPLSGHKKTADILQYILKNLHADLSMQKISTRFNMSERTLARLFQDQLDLSFHKYIKLARITKAIELLLDKNHNISEISELIGYKSIAAFSNAFVEMTRMRPTDFLKK